MISHLPTEQSCHKVPTLQIFIILKRLLSLAKRRKTKEGKPTSNSTPRARAKITLAIPRLYGCGTDLPGQRMEGRRDLFWYLFSYLIERGKERKRERQQCPPKLKEILNKHWEKQEGKPSKSQLVWEFFKSWSSTPFHRVLQSCLCYREQQLSQTASPRTSRITCLVEGSESP